MRHGGGRCVEIGDGADFAFAYHADRRHHGGYHHQHQHHHARGDGVDAVEILIVHKARFDAGRGFERNGQPTFGDAVFGVGGDQATDVALPKLDKVIGHIDVVNIIAGGNHDSLKEDGTIEVEIQAITGATNETRFGYLTAKTY